MPDPLHDLARRHVEATEEFLRITVMDGERATIGRLAAAMGQAARAVREALDARPPTGPRRD